MGGGGMDKFGDGAVVETVAMMVAMAMAVDTSVVSCCCRLSCCCNIEVINGSVDVVVREACWAGKEEDGEFGGSATAGGNVGPACGQAIGIGVFWQWWVYLK
eukprot:6796949-Ditylum_brightwellii.AAC.1